MVWLIMFFLKCWRIESLIRNNFSKWQSFWEPISCGSMKIRPKLNFFSQFKSMKEGQTLRKIWNYLFLLDEQYKAAVVFWGKLQIMNTLVRGLKISSILMDTTYYVIRIFGSATSLWTTMSICWSVCTIIFCKCI